MLLALIVGVFAGLFNAVYIDFIVHAERKKTRAAEFRLEVRELHQGIEEQRRKDRDAMHKQSREKVLYRLVPHNQAAVFATERRALFNAHVHRALRAKTWGEFSQFMPAGEYGRLMAEMFDEEEIARPEPIARFSADDIPGFSEGDYPPWLQPEMERVVPRDILERYGERKSTFVNGTYWHIPEEKMELVADALRKLGFDVVKARELPFY